MNNKKLFQVLASIALAVIAGLLAGPDRGIFGVTFVQIFGLIGQLFLNALTLVVVPLVASSIITGVARLGSEQSFGALGSKTLGYFILTSSLAALVGLAAVTLIEPGIALGQGALTSAIGPAADNNLKAIEGQIQGGAFDKVQQVILRIVPSNIIAAASQGQMLGLIVFCLLFGFFISRIEQHPASIVLGFWKGIFQIMIAITHLVMKALPVGVFGLVAKVVATTGVDAFAALGYFFITTLAAMFVFACIILPLLLRFIAGVSPLAHFRAMAPALLTAFSTSSSMATLPVTIDCVEKRAGVSNRICGFTVPLGTTLNLTATALYSTVVVLFIAQAYGAPITFSTQLIVFLMSVLISFGQAGIPSGSILSIVMIISTLGLPGEGIALIFAVERILDMFRTTINVLGVSCNAVIIARTEGEKDVLAARAAIVQP